MQTYKNTFNTPIKMKVKATIWFIYTPDESQQLIRYRWMLKGQSFTVVSNTTFKSGKNCIRSMKKIILRHNFELTEPVLKYRLMKVELQYI